MPQADGVVLFGYCLDILLYGILTVQIYIYYLSFPNDKRIVKATVAATYGIGTLQTAFALRDFYALLCLSDNHQGQDVVRLIGALTFRKFGFMWITIPLSGASVAAISQLFYAHRIHIISKTKLIPGVVIVLALLQFAVGIFIAFATYKNQDITDEVGIVARFLDALAWEMLGAICDLVITIYMFRFLSKRMQRSFRPTRVTVSRVKQLTLESGLLTTTVALAYVILSCVTVSGAFIIPGLALGKVYGNSILALLNSRLRIPGGRMEINSERVLDPFTMTERQLEI